MTQWTEQQKMVILSDERKLICSAAAGSGKTAVMVERILRLIRDGADPESFLIVTFTNAAASEMKEKIRNRLREERQDRRIRSAYQKVDMMQISTIHAFCQQLIRQEFQAAGVDPLFRICEAGVGRKLFSDAFRYACNQLLKENDPDFEVFRKRFDREASLEMIRKVYAMMTSLPDPEKWLVLACEGPPDRMDMNHPWFRTAKEIVKEKLDTAAVLLRRQYRMFEEGEHLEKYREIWKADSELFHVKQLWMENGGAIPEDLNAGFRSLPPIRGLNSMEIDWKERYGKIRESLKELHADIMALIFPDPDKVISDMDNIRESLLGLRKIVEGTVCRFAELKAKRRVLDFQDLEHKTLAVLRQPEYRDAVRKRIGYIFVDECQDVSAVQDAIIQALSGAENRLFMVGDVKQSIYRFRLADPTIFLRRCREFQQPETDGDSLDLQTNFRSRPEILETANVVFRDIMREHTAEMDYTPREELIPGRKEEGCFPVMVDLLEPKEGMDRLAALANYVTEQVMALREEGFDYRDMVILMPKVSGDGGKLAEALSARGIPVYFDGGADFYELEEVQTFLRLLMLLENPYQDLPLISVLRNAPFLFSEQELAEIRLALPERKAPFWWAFFTCADQKTTIGRRCAEAREKIAQWRFRSGFVPLGQLLYELASDSQLYALAGAGPAGGTARQNLRLLCARAEEAEKMGIYTLREFLGFVEEQAGGGDQRAPAPLAEGDDAVRIMTMHKSKGLQFKVVFCLGLDRSMAGRQEGQMMIDPDLGIALRYKQPRQRVTRKTAADHIFAWKKEHEEKAERIRLLYVGMTRAQERMFLAGVTEDRTEWRMPSGDHRVMSAGDYLDWIMPALLDAEKLSTGCAQGSKHWKIRIFTDKQQENVENRREFLNMSNWLNSLPEEVPVENVWKEMPAEEAGNRMAKWSVTSLIRNAEETVYGPEAAEEETPETKRIPDRFSRALRRHESGRYPAFMLDTPEKKGAWRGTVMHRFLSLIDLDRIRAAMPDPAEEIGRIRAEMQAAGILSPEEAEAIRTENIVFFLISDLGRRMLASPENHREWPFNLYLEDRCMLVQGVIDCAFLEQGEWVLLDYKTDHAEDPAELAEKYRPQLAWYAEALERLTGRPVREKWLYALTPGKAVRTG